MDIKRQYTNHYKNLLEEHRRVFEKQDADSLTRFIGAIAGARRIFVFGVGREGIALRSFAMRLMHLDKQTYWLWDDTTPGMEEGDLFIASNGSGIPMHSRHFFERARQAGAKIFLITAGPDEDDSIFADDVLFVPAAVYRGRNMFTVPSIQPMGNLYEQHLFLLMDIVVMLLSEALLITHADMERKHRNIE